MSFAENTSVPVERSRAEIERLLTKYGASKFISGWDDQRAVVGFEMRGRAIRMTLPLPKPTDPAFTKRARSRWGQSKSEAARRRFDQELRRRWRALLLVIKAKLEAVQSGIVTFEEEWLAHFVLPGGRTVADTIIPEIERAYASGQAPRLLLGYAGENEEDN